MKELLTRIKEGKLVTEAQLKLLEKAGYINEVAQYRSLQYARTQSYEDLAREWGLDDEDGEPVEQD